MYILLYRTRTKLLQCDVFMQFLSQSITNVFVEGCHPGPLPWQFFDDLDIFWWSTVYNSLVKWSNIGDHPGPPTSDIMWPGEPSEVANGYRATAKWSSVIPCVFFSQSRSGIKEFSRCGIRKIRIVFFFFFLLRHLLYTVISIFTTIDRKC